MKRPVRILLAIVILIALVAGAWTLLQSFAPQTSTVTLTTPQAKPILPSVTGVTLNNADVTLPDVLSAPLNIIVMPFTRDQQERAVAFLPFLQALTTEQDTLAYYSVSALPDLSPFARFGVVSAMQLGTTDSLVRDASIVLFLDNQEAFIGAMGVPDTEQTAVLIVRQGGAIEFVTRGDYSDALAQTVRDALSTLE